MLSRIDTSWQESGIPIRGCVLQGDDEEFREGGFIAYSYGGIIAHKKLAGGRYCRGILVVVVLCSVGAIARDVNVRPTGFWDL
jgi:hypothetical protein